MSEIDDHDDAPDDEPIQFCPVCKGEGHVHNRICGRCLGHGAR